MLLSTKLFAPMLRFEVVTRPRLLEQLNASLYHSLCLVSAPPGFGKTTLVRSWLGQQPYAYSWLSLDENDNDPITFFTYLAAAFQQIDPQIGAAIQDWKQPTASLLPLINNVVEFGAESVLVLDDYHLIDSTIIHQTLDYLLEYLPPNLHLVLISRTDPPLSLARLRARAAMTEIRAQDLRFTQDETMRFFATTTSLTLSPVEVSQLEERTEGWIAGLQMAAVALRGSNSDALADQSDFIRSFSGSHRYVSDYLIDEVLDRQPEQIRDFLIKSSILGRMCAANIAATLSDVNETEAQSLLEQLEATNLFIVPLDAERRWYRYHHLFAQLLQRRFQQKYADQALVHHRNASQWYLQHKLMIEAVNHALKGEDFALAADQIEMIGVAMGHQSVSEQQLTTWLSQLPIEIIRPRPRLAIQYITAQYRLNPQNPAIETIVAKFAAVAQTDGTQGEAVGFLNAFRLQISIWRGDEEHSRQLLQETHALLPKLSPLARCFVVREYFRFHFEMEGELDQAKRMMEVWKQYGEEAGLGFTSVAVPSRQGDIAQQRGKLQLAETYYRHALAASPQADETKRAYLYQPLLGLAQVYYQQNRLSDALAYAERANKLPIFAETEAVYPEFRLYRAATLATIYIANQSTPNALALIHDIGHFRLSFTSHYHQRLGNVTEAGLWLALGEVARVAPWAEKAKLYRLEPFRPLFAREQLTLARYEYLTEGAAAANKRLASLLPEIEAAGWNEKLLEALVLQALSYQAAAEMTKAYQALQRAIALAAPEGYIAIFVCEGAPMLELLRQATRNKIASEAVTRLLANFESPSKLAVNAPAIDRVSHAASHLIEPLSNRERDLLPLLAAGLTNQEIAQQLLVATSTVERHLANIYSKLQVNNRTHAVARARELNLLA